MDNYFDFDQAAIAPFDSSEEISSTLGDANQLDANEQFDSLFLDKSASLPVDGSAESGTVMLNLINDRKVEAVRWAYDPLATYPMFKAKTPCQLCEKMGMDCYLASRGMLITGCTACISLYRECSFTYPDMQPGYVATFPGIAEDEQVCHGPITTRRAAMNSFNTDGRGRKSGARFHRDAIKILKTWLSEHTDHPYPNERERDELKQLTGLKRSQINNWLANARRRGKVRPASDPPSPILGAMDIPTQPITNEMYENLNPLDRWRASPPEHEPASMTAIARAVTSNDLPHTLRSRNQSSSSLHISRPSSRKASSDDDSTNLSIMFQPPSVSSFETRESSNSTSLSLASSQSHKSRQSFASSQDRRRRRRNPLLHQRNSSTTNMGPPLSNPKVAKSKAGNGSKERIFQCTFCTDTFPSKYDWQRHEKSLHLALERWTCCPMGPTRIDASTGFQQCVFCPELLPTPSHLEKHNFQACNEKTVPERTFYRKDHLRQHLRLMHGVKFDPHMDTWKNTTFEIKSRCGFCPSLFTTWQSRADHLAAHFRNGCDMKDWNGGWGFEGFVERLVENALPPYLIGLERNTMNPYRAREARKTPLDSATKLATNLNAIDSTVVESSTACMLGDNSGGDLPDYDKVEVDQITKDSNCWLRLEEALIKYVLEQKSFGIMPEDKQIQDHARTIVYGDADPWDWTMADSQVWLDAFKSEHGLSTSSEDSSPEYQSTRTVPVAAPYVVKGGLKSNTRRTASHNENVGHRPSGSSLPGVQERTCPLAPTQSSNSSTHGGTPITPVEDILSLPCANHGLTNGQHTDLDFDAMDFSQLDINAFGEMEFENELQASQAGPVPAMSMMGYRPQQVHTPAMANEFMHLDMSSGMATGAQQKPLQADFNPFTGVDEAPEMTLETFDQLTGYMNGFSIFVKKRELTEKPRKFEESLDLASVKPLEQNFDWRQRDENPYRPWHDGPYHVTMGLKNAEIGSWIELDKTYLDKYRLKKGLYQNHRDEVLRALPGCEDGMFEALEILKDVLIRRYPTMFRMRDTHTIENLVTGDVWDLDRNAKTWETHHPLEVMGLLATEDFFLLQNDPATGMSTLRAGGVCFPAGFKIEDKIGLTLWQIHAGKVPKYEQKLAKSMDRFFMNLRTGSQIQRFNFAIDDSDELFHRHSHHNLSLEQLEKQPKLEDLHLRVERQVLQRLPRTRALLFTIRTYVTPITEVTRDHAVAKALRTNVDSFGEDLAVYKNMSLWNEILQKHIKEVLGEEDA
ncbi:hypothetical protein PMZ80_008864 [Knufia obscura]|uniref:Uncharacterized protein n=1 Tax=Knufia obscura TaxID=1635080 RepID=A0ABR0REL3_9EURO|nr:hypothetical protein PMZ80_008864 [Knufia obscura]